MAKKITVKKDSTTAPLVIQQLNIRQLRRDALDIAKWRNAIQSAESVLNPIRVKLYELYQDILLDTHLTTVMEKRITAITNSRINYRIKGQEGKEDKDLMELLRVPWFTEVLQYCMESKFWGHSLMEFVIQGGLVSSVELIPRHHVSPEKGIVSFNATNYTQGIAFREPPYSTYTLEVGKKSDLGMLMKAAPWVIYKRGGVADWAQFAELFGMPIRVAKYDEHNPDQKQQLQTAMDEAGSASYMVIPKGAEIDLHDGNNVGKADVYVKLLDASDKQLSKLILGNTMTTDDGSSYKQADVHKEVEEGINLADKVWLQQVLNFYLKPKLVQFGYPFAEGEFYFEDVEHLPMEKRMTIDKQLIEMGLPIDSKYFYEKYNVPPPASGVPEVISKPEPAPAPSPAPAPAPPENKFEFQFYQTPFNRFLNNLKKPFEKKKFLLNPPDYSGCGDHVHAAHQPQAAGYDGLIDSVLKDIAEGKEFTPEYFNKLSNDLIDSLHLGWGKEELDYTTEDVLCSNMMEANIFRFAASKTIAQSLELNKILQKSKTFAEFKNNSQGLWNAFNVRYLQTEYDSAQAIGQNASAYIRAMDDIKALPYWKYETVGDDRVRKAHQELDGKIFKANDPVFKTIYPPNGWNCRCEVVALPHHDAPLSDGSEILKKWKDSPEYSRLKKDGFGFNRGETGVVFSENQMYLKDKFEANLGVKSVYGNTDMLWKNIDKTSLPERKVTIDSLEKAKKWFDENKNADGNVEFADMRGKKIVLTEKTFNSHTGGKEDYYGDRPELLDHIGDVLNKPDEVWLQRRGNSETDTGYTYHYMKFFKDGILAVVTDFKRGTPFRVKSYYMLNKDDARNGIPVKLNTK